MIRFLVTNCLPVTDFIDRWGDESLRDSVEVIAYEELSLRKPFAPGLYVFSDLERLTDEELRFARSLAERLSAHPTAYRIMNDPRAHMGRLALIRLLRAEGINDFTAHKPFECGDNVRFPVFVRRERDHWGHSGLLHDRAALDDALREAAGSELLATPDLLVVEFSSTTMEDGLYKKYSVFRFGPVSVPRHILESPDWFTKTPDVVSEALCREELEFIRDGAGRNAPPIERAFDLAGVEYGRIDYGVQGDAIRIWEINSNPQLVPDPSHIAAGRLASQRESARRILEAFHAMDFSPAEPARRIFSSLSPPVLRKAVRRAGRVLGRRP